MAMTGTWKLKLPHGETDPAHIYVVPDPREVARAVERMHRATYYGGETISDREWAILSDAAAAYVYLTTDILGQEHCVAKLRDIWRAMRALREKP